MELKEKPCSNLFLERFKKGLMDWYGLTLDELIENYKYCGGDGGKNTNKSPHYNYWCMLFGYGGWPRKEHECVCGVRIEENCFVIDETRTNFVHMGNCCIKRFMPEGKSGRTCEICEEPHKNRKDNLCNDCRETHKRCFSCKEYFEFDEKKHEYCDECYERKKEEEREQRRRELEIRQKEIEENYKKSMKAKKGLINANQTAVKIKEIKTCSECNNNYETYNTIQEELLCDQCKNIKQKQIDEQNKIIKEEKIKKQQRIGLMCECGLETILREVKKDGPNKGKLFYCCSQYYDDKCDYFMWKDESNRRINRHVEITNNQEENKEEENEIIKCYCNLPVVLREVKKDGANKGRMFYTCSKYYDDKCKYFMWKE